MVVVLEASESGLRVGSQVVMALELWGGAWCGLVEGSWEGRKGGRGLSY